MTETGSRRGLDCGLHLQISALDNSQEPLGWPGRLRVSEKLKGGQAVI